MNNYKIGRCVRCGNYTALKNKKCNECNKNEDFPEILNDMLYGSKGDK